MTGLRFEYGGKRANERQADREGLPRARGRLVYVPCLKCGVIVREQGKEDEKDEGDPRPKWLIPILGELAQARYLVWSAG